MIVHDVVFVLLMVMKLKKISVMFPINFSVFIVVKERMGRLNKKRVQ
jgi:hypothetical protein